MVFFDSQIHVPDIMHLAVDDHGRDYKADRQHKLRYDQCLSEQTSAGSGGKSRSQRFDGLERR